MHDAYFKNAVPVRCVTRVELKPTGFTNTKTCPCNIQRFFSAAKKLKIFMRFLYIYIFFLIFAQNIDRGYKLEPPRRGGSNEYHNLCFVSKMRKNRYAPAYPSFTV